jgi:hypothetical protein
MENILIKTWYNYDDTNDHWIYDLSKSKVNPVTVYISVSTKFDSNYVKNLFLKERKHITKSAPTLTLEEPIPRKKKQLGGDFLDEFFGK